MTATAIAIDSREPAHIQQLAFDGLPKLVYALDCGDIWISTDSDDLIIVERKTPDDLLSSIKDHRVFQQAKAMREKSPWCYVMVTDSLAYNHSGKVVTAGRVTGWAWASVQGALLDIQELGVRVAYCQGDQDFEKAVLRLARRARTAEKVIESTAQPRIMSPAEQMLTSLPGIGWERAQTLLDAFPSPAEALCWLTNLHTISEVAGIGDGTKRNVRRVLGLENNHELTIWSDAAAKYLAQYEAKKERMAA